MEQIVGLDPNGNIRQLGIIGKADAQTGLIITRTPILTTDVFNTQYTVAGLAVGGRTLSSVPLAEGYLYHIFGFGGRWYNGTANNVRIGYYPPGNIYVSGDNALAAGVPIRSNYNFWVVPATVFFIEVNVTVAPTNLELWVSYIRTPLPS